MFSDLNLSAIRGSEATALASALYEAGEISREQKDIMQITALIASDVEDAPINLPQELNAIANQPNLPSFRNADDLATLLLDLYEEVKPNEAGRAEPSTVEVSSNQAQPTPERLDIRA